MEGVYPELAEGFTLAPYRDLAVSTKPLVLLSLRSSKSEGGHQPYSFIRPTFSTPRTSSASRGSRGGCVLTNTTVTVRTPIRQQLRSCWRMPGIARNSLSHSALASFAGGCSDFPERNILQCKSVRPDLLACCDIYIVLKPQSFVK